MTYVSAPLWLLSLALSTAFIVLHTMIEPQYFVEPRQLFPLWPEWDTQAAIAFAAATGVVLVLPKILGAVLVLARDADRFGGRLRVTLSLVMEILFSALLAPVRMLFHAQFVIAGITGWGVRWKSPSRVDAETRWSEAIRRHGVHTLVGIIWILGIYSLDPVYVWWLLPVAGALALSIPLSVYSSRVSLGRALRRVKLFAIPEELDPPTELRIMRTHVNRRHTASTFVDAVVDPVANAMACATAEPHMRLSPSARSRRERAVAAALEDGPHLMTDPQKLFFLTDAFALVKLHLRVWTSAAAHPSWLTVYRSRPLDDDADLPQAS